MRAVSLVILGLFVAGAAHAQSSGPGNAHVGQPGGLSLSGPRGGKVDAAKSQAQAEALAKLKEMQAKLLKMTRPPRAARRRPMRRRR